MTFLIHHAGRYSDAGMRGDLIVLTDETSAGELVTLRASTDPQPDHGNDWHGHVGVPGPPIGTPPGHGHVATPEPSTAALLVLGLGMVLISRWRA